MHYIRKLMAYLASWGNFEQETCAFYGKYWIENLTLFDLDLTTDLRQNSGWITSWGQMTATIEICVQNDTENICHTACLWLLFYGDILWPSWPWARPFANMPFVLMQYPFWTSIQHFDWRVWPLFAARLTDPRAQKVKTLHCDLWPDLDLTRDLNLKILNLD